MCGHRARLRLRTAARGMLSATRYGRRGWEDRSDATLRTHGRGMGADRAVGSTPGRHRSAATRPAPDVERDLLGDAQWRSVARPARTLRALGDGLLSFQHLAATGGVRTGARGAAD